MALRVLKTHPDIVAALPILKPEEKRGLLESIQNEGVRDPIVVWKGEDVIVDGHNRYGICQEFGFEFQVTEIEFETVEDAVLWVKINQLSKRNLTDNQRMLLIGEIYNSRKRDDGGHGDQKSGHQVDAPKTKERVAQEVGVSQATVERCGKFAQQIEVIREKAGPKVVLELRNETIKTPLPHITFLAKQSETKPEIVAEYVETPRNLRAKKVAFWRGTIYNQSRPSVGGALRFEGKSDGVPAKALTEQFGCPVAEIVKAGRFAATIEYLTALDESLADWVMESSVPLQYAPHLKDKPIEFIQQVRAKMDVDGLKFKDAVQDVTQTMERLEKHKETGRAIDEVMVKTDKKVEAMYHGADKLCFPPNVKEWLCLDCNWGFDTYPPEPGAISCPYCNGTNLEKRDPEWLKTRGL